MREIVIIMYAHTTCACSPVSSSWNAWSVAGAVLTKLSVPFFELEGSENNKLSNMSSFQICFKSSVSLYAAAEASSMLAAGSESMFSPGEGDEEEEEE